MSLLPFLNRHVGETAWLFGKGPSFSTFDFKTAGPLRVAINDVVQHVPCCKYGFSNDGVKNWRDCYSRDQILFQPVRCLGEFDSTQPGAVDCHVVTYKDTHDDARLALGQHAIAELPAIRRGTLGSALQILHVMGVKCVHLIGIDGGGTHAQGFEWRTRIRNDHARDYNAIRNAAIDSAFLMGIALKFHNSDHTMETNGKVFVRFTANAFANAEPYSQGEIASFNPKVAAQLIAARCAEPFNTPKDIAEKAPAVIETAEVPMQARENSAIKTKKGKR